VQLTASEALFSEQCSLSIESVRLVRCLLRSVDLYLGIYIVSLKPCRGKREREVRKCSRIIYERKSRGRN
jgi:hypothetical protein